MAKKKLKQIRKQLTEAERQRHARVREAVKREFSPKETDRSKRSLPGIPSQIRAARQAQGLTWYALAKQAGIPNQGTVRDIEQGKDVKLSNLQAVANSLGLKLELTEELI